MRRADRLDAGAISAALAERMHSLVVDLRGQPDERHGDEWRWGRKGSLRVFISGPKRGRWHCFDPGDPRFGAEGRGDALDLIQLAHGIGFADALRWALEWLCNAGVRRETPAVHRRQRSALGAADPNQACRIASALRIWNGAGPLWDSPAASYLLSRKVEVTELPEEVAESLRFHPKCPRGPAPYTRFLRALIGLLRDIRTDEPCGVRRIFLEPNDVGGWRKMGGGSEKMALGRAAGAAVKLTPDADVTHGLALTEGVENALTLAAEGLAPIWAAGDADKILAFPVLAGVESLKIFADRDPTGLEAAQVCRARWRAEGREARVIPPRDAKDWNDIVRGREA